ncbi:MAG: hypothetical protein HZA00_04485 [Nitrospinae bacterium]|nr:hypothetical protein [Nitrospinota bacterium]
MTNLKADLPQPFPQNLKAEYLHGVNRMKISKYDRYMALVRIPEHMRY